MKVTETGLPGVLVIEPAVFGDERGYFLETYHAGRYAEAGIPGPFVQDNVSRSGRGVLRGMHFQHPHAQGKLVQVLEGEVFDVALDIRRGSPTFGAWVGEYLSSETKRQMYLPPGFAHGFLVTSADALFAYKCTTPYDRAHDRSIRWDDPALGIRWPAVEVIMSAKDRDAPLLSAIAPELLPDYVA